MAQGPQDWSLTAGSNGTADANINWAEGQLGPTVNNSARAMMSAIRAYTNTIGGGVAYGGASNAYTITNDGVGAWTSLTAPRLVLLKANHTCSGASTVAVDGLAATAITKGGATAVASGDIVSGAFYWLAYDGTRFQIVGDPVVSLASYQPLDATLTALAALTIASGKIIKGTGVDTFSTIDIGTMGETILATANEAAFKTATNLTIGTNVQAYNANTAVTSTAATWSAAQSIRVKVSSETTGSITAANSANASVLCSGGITLDNAIFTAGDITVFDSNGAARTFTRGASVTMYVNGTNSATATLAIDQTGTAYWRTASVVVLSGGFS